MDRESGPAPWIAGPRRRPRGRGKKAPRRGSGGAGRGRGRPGTRFAGGFPRGPPGLGLEAPDDAGPAPEARPRSPLRHALPRRRTDRGGRAPGTAHHRRGGRSLFRRRERAARRPSAPRSRAAPGQGRARRARKPALQLEDRIRSYPAFAGPSKALSHRPPGKPSARNRETPACEPPKLCLHEARGRIPPRRSPAPDPPLPAPPPYAEGAEQLLE